MTGKEQLSFMLQEAQTKFEAAQKAFQEAIDTARRKEESVDEGAAVDDVGPCDVQPGIPTRDLLEQLNSIQQLIEQPPHNSMALTEWEARFWEHHTDLGILMSEFVSDQLTNQDVPKLPSWNMTFKYSTKLANIGLPILLNRHIKEIDNVDIRVHLFRNQTEMKLLVDTLDGLNPSESRLVQLKYGLADGTCRTLEETARDLGMNLEQTNQIEVAALRKLRNLWAHNKFLSKFTTNPSSAFRITDFFERLKRLQEAWKMLQRFYLVERMDSPTPKQNNLAMQFSKTQSYVSRMVSAGTEIFEDALIYKLLTQQHPGFETQINSGFGGTHRYLLKKTSGVDKDSFELKCSVTLITARSRSLPGKIQDALRKMVSNFEEEHLVSGGTATVHGLLIPQAPTVPLAPPDPDGRFSPWENLAGELKFIDRDKLRRELESMGQDDSRREVLKAVQENLAKSDASAKNFNSWAKVRDLDPDELARTLEPIVQDGHQAYGNGTKLGTTIYFFDHKISLEDIPTTRNIHILCNWIMKNSTPDVSKFEEHTVGRYVVRYIGSDLDLVETLTHVRLERHGNCVEFKVRCPFCSGLMERTAGKWPDPNSLAERFKRNTRSKSEIEKTEHYECEKGHRVSLVPSGTGKLGWEDSDNPMLVRA